MRRRTIVSLSLAAALLLSVVAASATPAAPRAKKVLRFAIGGEENNLTPLTITFGSGKTEDLIGMVYDTLWSIQSGLHPRPLLVRSFSVTKDKRTWTVRIRSGVKFHDGTPLTTRDVAFTYLYMFKANSGLYSHHVDDQPKVRRVRVLGGNRIRFTCARPCATFDIDPGGHIPILPEHIWKDVPPLQATKFTQQLPVGSGPYKLAEWQKGQFYRLVANDRYFLGRPKVDEIVLPIIPDSSAMFLALRAHQVDAVSRSVPPEAVSGLRGAGLKILTFPDYSSAQIFINTQRFPLNIAKVRKALNLGVDTAAITKTLLAGLGRPGVESAVSPDSPYANKTLKHVFSPARARALLDSLEIRDRNGDGVRETSNGKELSFDLLVSSREAREVRAAELVGDQLKAIGVQVRATPVDPTTLRARRQPPEASSVIVQKTKHTGNYDMYIGSFISLFHFHDDPDGLLYFFHCPGETGFGAFEAGYCNKKFDRLVDRATTLDTDARIPLLKQAQTILYNDPPVISLYFPDGVFAYDPKVYDRWVPVHGHGIFNKFSFIPNGGNFPSPEDVVEVRPR